MKPERKYLDRFQDNLLYFFNNAVELNLTSLRQCGFWIRTLNHQTRAGEVRRKRLEQGLPAPGVMICSVTGRCNLKCSGCYAMARKHTNGMEISTRRFESLTREAADMGTNIIMIAGGEPLLRMGILEAAARSRDIIFPVFTNGTLMDSERIRFFKQHKNLIPVLSIEGNMQLTDRRRGEGIHARVISVAEAFRRSKKFFGLSLTLTRENYAELTEEKYLRQYRALGCRLFFLIEYVPMSNADLGLCITDEQRKGLPDCLEKLRERLPALYVSLPGDEERYGGCLAAGRGFIHVSSTGNIEACPFAPFSDSNILNTPLSEALNSALMSRIRESHHLLKESAGGCTLWENREWVEEQIQKPGILSA